MIGVFDSGLGGLTLARALISARPDQELLYLADTAHLPYGSRGLSELRTLSRNCADTLMDLGADLIVIACNTASAASSQYLRSELNIPVLEVVEPTARAAVERSVHGRIGVIATEATVASNAYPHAIRQAAALLNFPEPVVVVQAAPLLVPMIERGVTRGPQMMALARLYAEPLITAKIDTMILGCTHYPLISAVLREVLGEGVQLVSSGEPTVREVLSVLGAHARSTDVVPRYRFLASGNSETFGSLATRFLAKSGATWPGKMSFEHIDVAPSATVNSMPD